MKTLTWMGIVLLLLVGCGDSNDSGAARTAAELCDQVCGWPDDCFSEFGVPVQDAECIQACEASVEAVGMACLQAIHNTIECVGTCNPDAITDDDIARCQSAARAIESSCD
jgi:hypothetical protein